MTEPTPEPPSARTLAAIRLREALDMERATSGGNAASPSGIAGFVEGWLDYIVEPYLDAARDSRPNTACREHGRVNIQRLREAMEITGTPINMGDWDEWALDIATEYARFMPDGRL